jgi:hypothetical protein
MILVTIKGEKKNLKSGDINNFQQLIQENANLSPKYTKRLFYKPLKKLKDVKEIFLTVRNL